MNYHCQWCDGREGGCRYCRSGIPQRDGAVVQNEGYLMMEDESIIAVRTVITREVWRVPPPNPDREPCVPDPDLASMFDDRTAEERGVAIVPYDFEWNALYERLMRQVHGRKRKKEPQQIDKYAKAWWK